MTAKKLSYRVILAVGAGIYGKDYVWFTIKSMNYLRGIQVLVDDMDKGKGRVDEGGPVKTAIDLNRQFLHCAYTQRSISFR